MTIAAQAYARHRRARRFGRLFIPFWIGLAVTGTLIAGADVLWHLGWGYRWKDVLLGSGMVVFGFVFWALWNLTLRLVEWLTQIFLGSDPSEPDPSRTNSP